MTTSTLAAPATEAQTYYSIEQVLQAVVRWCEKHPAWVPIFLLEDNESDQYYVQWDELSPTQQAHWQSEYGYDEFATKRCKVKTGQITGDGQYHESGLTIPIGRGMNSCMVFCVGRQRADELRDRAKRFEDAIQEWLAQNPEWMRSRDISQEGRRLLYVQWDELTPEIQARWGTPERYKGSGTMRCKCQSGFAYPGGFSTDFKELPESAQRKYELVFQVGRDHAPYQA